MSHHESRSVRRNRQPHWTAFVVGHAQTRHPRGQEDRLTDWAGALTCLGVLSIDALCARLVRLGR